MPIPEAKPMKPMPMVENEIVRMLASAGRQRIEAEAQVMTLRTVNADLLAALKAAQGYLLNAKIDLETKTSRTTAINTIVGGLRVVIDAIARAEAR